MTGKEWQAPFGERKTGQADPIGEIVRKNIADQEQKKMGRQNEIEDLEHKAKVEELKGVGKAPSPIQLKPMELDVQRAEKDAVVRAEKAEEREAAERQSRRELETELEKERIANLENKLGSQISDLKKVIEDNKVDKGSVTEKLAEIKSTAGELGWGPKEAGGVSPEIQIQITQMNNDLKLKLAEMEDERSRRDKDWQLTLRKWDDEKDMRQQELNQKAAADQERTGLMTSMQQGLGRIIGKSLTDNGGPGIKGKVQSEQFHVDADVGEEGDISCPSCSTSIFLPSDAVKIACPSCGAIGIVRRLAKQGASIEAQEAKTKSPEI